MLRNSEIDQNTVAEIGSCPKNFPIRLEKYIFMNVRTVGTDWSGQLRGPEFYLVRYVDRILDRIFLDPVRGPEFGPKIRFGVRVRTKFRTT